MRTRTASVFALVAVAACSYGPHFADCEISCQATTGCPDGFTCSRSTCRSDDATDTCLALGLGNAQEAYIKASNAGADDRFGAVALSANGSTLVVGAQQEDSPRGDPASNALVDASAAYVFEFVDERWQQTALLKATVPGAGDYFGFGVAVSADGSTLVVGAPGESSSAMGVNGADTNALAPASGAAYVFIKTDAGWIQQAFLKASNPTAFDELGYSVAISADGSLVAIGAVNEDSSTTGVGSTPDDAATDAGAVYTFVRTGDSWAPQAYIKASNTDAGDGFGDSVALSGDGSTLAVGVQHEASDGAQSSNLAVGAGAVYVFARDGATWAQQAYVKATPAHIDDRFGNKVQLSADGATLAVAAYGDAGSSVDPAPFSGAVYLFGRAGTSWTQHAYLQASERDTDDQFGVQIALSANGQTVAIGAHKEDSSSRGIDGDPRNNGATDSGAVYVFTADGDAWSQRAYIKAPNADALDYFGSDVSISADGRAIAVGAKLEDGGATGIDGEQGDNSAPDAGAAYLFR